MKLISNETKVIIRTKDTDNGSISEKSGIFIGFANLDTRDTYMLILVEADEWRTIGKKEEFVIEAINSYYVFIPKNQQSITCNQDKKRPY